jgi:hypothetical protein
MDRNANGVPRRSDWTATLNESLRASGGALLVLACRPHHIRVIARMLERHSAASVVFTDAVPKGKVSALLFDPLPGCSVSAMLASVLGDESLCRSLVSAPSTVDHACGSSASPASEAFVAAAQRAHAADGGHVAQGGDEDRQPRERDHDEVELAPRVAQVAGGLRVVGCWHQQRPAQK